MLTLGWASFASHLYSYLHFQSLPFWFFFSASVARASASLEGSWTHFCVQSSSVKLIGFLALQYAFSLFQKKMHWKIGKLISYKPENWIPWLFTDFANIKDFPWRFPDCGIPNQVLNYSHICALTTVPTSLKVLIEVNLPQFHHSAQRLPWGQKLRLPFRYFPQRESWYNLDQNHCPSWRQHMNDDVVGDHWTQNGHLEAKNINN